jgi:DNA invertase Pin-like site-specific DNA recombinase
MSPRTAAPPGDAASTDGLTPEFLARVAHIETHYRTLKVRPPVVVDVTIRVSARKGRTGDRWQSPEEQLDDCVRAAKLNGAVIRKVHLETDSVKGHTTDRVGLNAAMTAIFANHSDGLLVAYVSRFSRSSTEGLLAIRRLRKKNKRFISAREGINTWDPRDAMAQLMLTMLLGIAEWEWETKRAEFDRHRRKAIEIGVASHAAYGYLRDDRRRLVPDPETAPVVKQIYRWRGYGWGYERIAERLTDDGVPTPTGGSRWGHSVVYKILHNRVYLGELAQNIAHRDLDDDEAPTVERLVSPVTHPAIITATMWRKARAVDLTTPRQENDTFPLAGLLRCGTCGGRLTGANDTVEGRVYRYYKCGARRAWGRCSPPARINADHAESIVFTAFRADYADGRVLDASASDEDLDQARDTLDQARAELNDYNTGENARYVKATAGDDAYTNGLRSRADDVARAREQLADIERRTIGVAWPQTIAVWDASEGLPDDRRMWLAVAYPVIVVAPRAEHQRRRRESLDAAAERVFIWCRGDVDVPAVAGHGAQEPCPIVFPDRPSRAGVSLLEAGDDHGVEQRERISRKRHGGQRKTTRSS